MEQTTLCALVTGASRGIGAGIARVLAQHGYDIAFTYATAREEAEKLAQELRQAYGRRVFFTQASLEEPDVPLRTVRWAVQALGHINLLVNNAGVTLTGSILSMDEKDMEKLFNLDFRAYVMCTRYAARHMVKHGIPGNIICITSTHSVQPYPGDSMYGAVKAALNRAAESWALDLAPYGIRVNCIAPGATRVRDFGRFNAFYENLGPKIPLGRIGTPEEMGEAVLFLADNERAGYITGVTLKIDGGLVLPGMPEGIGIDRWAYVRQEKTWNDSDL